MPVDDIVFHKLESLYPGTIDSPWFIYAGLVLQANDQMDAIKTLWSFIDNNTPRREDRIIKARQLREALLKASSLVGFPKGINACMALRKAIQATSPDLIAELDKDKSLRKNLQRAEKDARGKAFFSKIYAQHTDRVLENMALASGGDLSEFAINAIYGDLMAETSRLDAKHTGLLEFLACYATGGSASLQAKGHLYGSINLGNTQEEIRGVVDICTAIEKQLGLKINRAPAEDWAWLSKIDR